MIAKLNVPRDAGVLLKSKSSAFSVSTSKLFKQKANSISKRRRRFPLRHASILIFTFLNIFFFFHWAINTLSIHVSMSTDDSNSLASLSEHFPDNVIPDQLSDIQRYIAWHAQMSTCLRHRNCTEEPKILLWRCPFGHSNKCSGLGDRFRGIQFSILLAILTKRVFFMEWPLEPYPFSSVVQPSLIDWRLPKHIDYSKWGVVAHYKWPHLNWLNCPPHVNCTSLSTLKSKTFGHLTEATDMENADLLQVFNSVPNLSIYTTATGDSTNKIFNNKVFAESTKSYHPLKIGIINVYKLLLRLLLKPSNGIVKRMKERGLLRGPYTEYMSIHLRTGADIGEKKLPRFMSFPDDKTLSNQVFQCLESMTKGKPLPIFLASDSRTFKKEFGMQGKARRISVTSNFVPPVHIAKLDKSSRKASKSTLEKFMNLYLEFFGIAQATRIVGNRSGFSKMAYYTGYAKDYIRFTPSNISKAGDTWECHII